MAGTVYLRTNRFEVKLEGITFKAKEFESLCTVDFLFPEGKIWVRPPVVGIDVMRHPRDPTIILVLLCFGVGCLILRFHSGDPLPDPFLKFLRDERIRFVGFGIPEKKNLFPFEELRLTKDKVDIGYLATKHFNNPKYKRCELGELARKVLGIKRMIGLTEASSFERHEQIKCAICQLFISTVIAMSLFSTNDKKKLADAPKKTSSFLKNLSSLPLLSEGWFKFPKGKKNLQASQVDDKLKIAEFTFFDDSWGAQGKGQYNISPDISRDSNDDIVRLKAKEISTDDDSKEELVPIEDTVLLSKHDSKEVFHSNKKKPLKGILKCPSAGLEAWNSLSLNPDSPLSVDNAKISLRRANSKGCNVSFKEQWLS